MRTQNNYYEILNASPEASALGIVKAYREIKLIFQANSLAAYSLYSQEELEMIHQRIEEAYAVLSNSDARREYNKKLEYSTTSNKKSASKKISEPKDEPLLTVKIISTPEKVHGKVLRKIRKQQDLSLNQIAAKTNIPKAYLKALETQDISILPGRFYLKSYFKQYVTCLGLNPTEAWKKYKLQLKD